MSRFSGFIVLISVLLFLTACGSNEKLLSVDPKYKEWVSGYTSGVISNSGTIQIELSHELDSTFVADHELKSGTDVAILKDILEFSPEVEGKVTWLDERTIEFEPKDRLPSNQLYTVTMDLERVANVEDGYEEFVFQFATMPQKIAVDNVELLNYDSYNIEWYYAKGILTTSDICDTTKLKEVITAEYKNARPVRLESTGTPNEYRFTVDSIRRQEAISKLKLEWDGSPIESTSKGRKTLPISSLHDFTLTNHDVTNSDEQTLNLTFSEPILATQDLTGLIDIEGIEGETFSMYYNQITVFLPHLLEGEHEIRVNSGIRNIKGYTMEKGVQFPVTFEPPGPSVRVIGEGSILPDSKGLIFPFETIGLKSVTIRIIKVYEDNVHHFLQVNDLDGSDAIFRFGKKLVERNIKLHVDKATKNTWATSVINLEKWINPEPGAIYRVSIKFSKKDTWCDCPESENTEETSDESDYDESWSERPWHLDDWDDGYADWGHYGDDSPCSEDYYWGRAVSRNILASNIGIIYKMDGFKTGHTFVSDMISTEPMPNTSITFYDYAKQVIASGTTDSQGMFITPLSRKPFLLVAKHGNQRGYLKVGDSHSNSLSEFEVDGEEVTDGLKGFIYGDRGVWRPGDSLFLNFILRDPENKLPDNHPITMTLFSPGGEEVHTITKTQGLNGHYDFRTATSANAPTGVYWATVKVGAREFTKYLKIETVKPNRLKIKIQIPEYNTKDSLATLQSMWLHGAPAKKLDAKVEVELHSQRTIIPGFETYVFDSPVRELNTGSSVLYDAALDNEGKASFDPSVSNLNNAPGMLKATYTMRVFEKGGAYSIDRFSQPYSPYTNYVGLKLPQQESDETFLSGKKHRFDVALTSPDGKLATKTSRMRVKIYRMEWVWWYETADEDITDFIAKNGNTLVFDSMLTTSTGKSAFNYGIGEQEYGRFLITVTDEQGLHQTGKIVVIDRPMWSRGNQSNAMFASMLNFSTDKKTYSRGELVKITIPTASSGKALISVESRKRIIKTFWVNTQKGETTCSFEATAEMTPNVYVHVTLLQPHSATVNDLPIRMYGILPIFIDDPATHLHPVVHTPKEWRPESTARIAVSEENGKQMTYTIAVVDEGLLDLTRFKTPNPWGTFYAKEALGIKTWDMYNDVIGAFGGSLNNMISIGGDGSANDGAGPKANRFKPMVHFLGPFVLPAGSRKTHQLELPTYVGSVRVMVIAHDDNAFGSGESTVTIKKPLMVLGTLPRVISPTETIQIPVDVFAMEKSIRNVQVEITTNEFLKCTGKSTQTLQFKDIGDEMANFEVKVADKMGVAKVKIVARSGSETAVQEFEVDVRSPNPAVRQTVTKTIQPGETASLPISRDGIQGSHSYQIELSTIVSCNISGRMEELIQYPHGCIEQTTSSVFPQLVAQDIMHFDTKRKNVMNDNIKAALKRYHSFQTYEGGFGYWPGDHENNEWGSNYAGHFMIEAELHGFDIPAGMKAKWLNYQKEQANNWKLSDNSFAHTHAEDSYENIQAYRLYTLALAGKPEMGAMNRMKELPKLSATSKWRLAGAYYLAGQKEIAKQLTASTPLTEKAYRELAYSYGSDLRDKAMILEMVELVHPKKANNLRKEIAEVLSSNEWLSTQETGYCILALCSAQKKQNNGMSAIVNKENIAITACMKEKFYSESDLKNRGTITVTNKGKTPMYVTFTTVKTPKIGKEKNAQSKLNMDVTYLTMDGKVIRPDELVQGTDFIIRVGLHNTSFKLIYKEMALNQLIPSGWEIMNTRLFDGEHASAADYQDIRDDRVYSYFDLIPGERKTIEIQVNASYLGHFYLPAIYTEAMYDNTIYAQQKGRWVDVIKPEAKAAKNVVKNLKKKTTNT